MPTPRRARTLSVAGNARPLAAQRMAVLAASLNAAQRRQAAPPRPRRRRANAAAPVRAVANANYKRKLLSTIGVTRRLIRNSYSPNYNTTLARVKNFINSANNVQLKARAKNIFNAYNAIPNSRPMNAAERNNLLAILGATANWSKNLNIDTKKRIKELMYSSLSNNTKKNLLGSILDLISIYSPRHANAMQNAAENYAIKHALGRAAFLRRIGVGRGQARRIIGGARETARRLRQAA